MAGYKVEKISESIKTVKETRDFKNIHIHISMSNSKLGNIPSFNLLPGFTCSTASCKHCLKEGCYAVKNMFCHGYDVNKNNVLSAWTENTVIMMTDLEKLYDELDNYLNSVKNTIKLFRIHSSGDFKNVQYAKMWYRLAAKYTTIRFLAFTKQWDIVREVNFYNLPNFSLVLSGWTGIDIPEDLRKFYRCAWCNDGKENRIPENAMLCPGSCESCGLCWYLGEIGRDTQFTKH